jgi:hypothetical protein
MMKIGQTRLSICLVLGLTLSGCASGKWLDLTRSQPMVLLAVHAVAETSSPWQTGLGVRGNVRAAASDAGALYVLGSYQRQWFDGGHDNVFSLGLQGRRIVAEGGTFVGPELTYNNWRVSDGGSDPISQVIGAGVIVGHPIGEALNLWSTVGLLQFSDFETDGVLVYEGGTGFQANFGVELRNPFGGD